MTTALEPGEVLVEAFLALEPGSGWGLAKVFRRAGDYAPVAGGREVEAVGDLPASEYRHVVVGRLAVRVLAQE